jgi:cytoskeletal protein RodZ
MTDSQSEVVNKSAGQLLQEARLVKGFSLSDAADYLCLRKAMVVALEEDDYQQWSCWVYYRGHLQRYAQWLGLDYLLVKQALLPECQKILLAPDDVCLARPPSHHRLQKRRILLVGAGLSVVFLGVVFLVFSFFHHHSDILIKAKLDHPYLSVKEAE